MYIFLDSNIYFGNWFLQSADFKFLINFLDNSRSCLILSEVVCEEMQHLYEKGLNEQIIKTKKEIGAAKQYYPEEGYVKLSLQQFAYSFKNVIENKISNIQYVEYSNVSHLETVKRAINGIKPFQENGRGYRDTLIWISFLSFLKDKKIKGEVAFVTKNRKDFYNDSGNFHADLLTEIEEYKLECNILSFETLGELITKKIPDNVKQFNFQNIYDQYLSPIEYKIEKYIEEAINRLSPAELKKQIHKNSRKLPLFELSTKFFLEVMEGTEDPEILKCHKLEEHSIYLSYRLNFRRCWLIFYVSKGILSNISEKIEIYYDEVMDYSDDKVLTAYGRLYLEVSFSYNIETNALDGISIEKFLFE